MKKTDPDTKHPVYHLSKRNLALISCVPPNLAKEDNPAILPSTALRNLENKGGGGNGNGGTGSGNNGGGVGGGSRGGGGGKKKSSASGDNSTGDSSSFTHTIELVSQGKEDRELAHLAVQVATIREAFINYSRLMRSSIDPRRRSCREIWLIQCYIKCRSCSFVQINSMSKECKMRLLMWLRVKLSIVRKEK